MEQHGISKLDLKRQNRMHVLKILKQRGPTSRIDIAGALELTRAAVTIITNEMIEQGIIVELGEYKQVAEKTPRGRKKILIDVNSNFRFTIGIAIECENVSVGMSTLSGAVLDKRNLAINDSFTFGDITDFIKKSVNDIINDNYIDPGQLLGIGIGVYPGMFRRMEIPIVNGAADYSPLRKLFEKEYSLPVVVDNSVKGMAMANIDFLKVKDAERRNIAFLQCGDSMHFVVTNLNDPIVSYDNRTDFVDRIIIDPKSSEVCDCGRKGCCRTELSPSAMIKKVTRIFGMEKTPFLYKTLGGDPSKIDMDSIRDSCRNKDEGTLALMSESLDMMAVLLNNLYFTTNPQKIVLHNIFADEEKMNAYLIPAVERIGGSIVASKITLSIIDEKQRFLSGCALAIRELFYDKGGFVAKASVSAQ